MIGSRPGGSGLLGNRADRLAGIRIEKDFMHVLSFHNFHPERLLFGSVLNRS